MPPLVLHELVLLATARLRVAPLPAPVAVPVEAATLAASSLAVAL